MSGWRPSAPPPPGGWRPPKPTRTGSGGAPRRAAGGQAPLPPRTDPSSGPDPEAVHSVLLRARDQSRFVAPEIEEEPPRRRFPWKGALALVTVVVALAVGAGAFYALVVRKPTVGEGTTVKPSPGTSETRVLSPQDVVRTYLESLASGDIDAALALGPTAGDETSTKHLLSPAAHRAMRKRAPITDIQIRTEDPKATTVEASYKLAGKDVQTKFPVVLGNDGSYQLERTTVTVIIELSQAEALPLLVNGVEVQKYQPMEVVPGVYELTTGHDYIEYPPENTFTIGSLQYADTTSLPATPRLTDEGRQAFVAAARTALERCVAVRAPAPEGCPQQVRAAKPLAPGSVRWTLVGQPFSSATASLSTADLTVAVVPLDLHFRMTARYADGSDPGTQDFPTTTVRATANMLGEDPDDITIVWER